MTQDVITFSSNQGIHQRTRVFSNVLLMGNEFLAAGLFKVGSETFLFEANEDCDCFFLSICDY